MSGIASEFLMDLRVDLADASYSFGQTPLGNRGTGAIKGGTFSGPRLNGTLEPYGADWMIVRPDDTLDPEVKAVLKTDDGALIAVEYSGIIHPMSQAFAGADAYWRVAMRFATSAEKYDWLNRIIAIGQGRLEGRSAIYKIWEVK
jgi:hypothetical protein